ncbi:MAG: nitrophenyl compound nitroreductase subunit ArsF family protein, partial [Elusimicrobiales bacterium]|nr:nitrophenyl compound nitroreductase subunit ArsF family protein [Elusimicrobiales bacterium]
AAPAAPAAAPAADEVAKPAVKTPAAALKASAAKTALVYYFYTDTRCSSCQTIEAYTKEAVEKNFAADYKGWRVAFKGVNLDEEPNAHFKQDYQLDSKSVVVQKFSGDKALKWGKLEKVWQLLGDKAAFMEYVSAETHKLLDEK